MKSKLSKGVRIVVLGNNHHLEISRDVTFKSGRIWFEDNGCIIRIGKGTTIENASLSAAENSTSLEIGEDCMVSADVRISTTDAHSIIDLDTGKRTNPAKDIKIGNHVWVGWRVSVNKGVTIGDNSVIAGNSVVTKDIQSNCAAAGVPAKVVKERINWKRER